MKVSLSTSRDVPSFPRVWWFSSGSSSNLLQNSREIEPCRISNRPQSMPISISTYISVWVLFTFACADMLWLMAIVRNLGDGVLFKGLVLAEPGIP